ncbi:MAG: hypothetical protein EOP48_23590, partial [Sphingobacteriales bacterium]
MAFKSQAREVIVRPGDSSKRRPFMVAREDFTDIRLNFLGGKTVDYWFVQRGNIQIEQFFTAGKLTRYKINQFEGTRVKEISYSLTAGKYRLTSAVVRWPEVYNMDSSLFAADEKNICLSREATFRELAEISKAIDKIYRQQGQIQYANDISSTTLITYISFSDTYVTNNTNYIKGELPFELFKKGIEKLVQIQTHIYSEFKLENADYDPDVKAILFEEVDCNRFPIGIGPNVFCNSFYSLGLSTKLVSVLTLFKDMLDQKMAAYLAMNKSSLPAMIQVALQQLSYIQGASSLLGGESQLINRVISQALEKSVDDIHKLGNTILIIFSVTLAVVSVLIWFQILNRVREVNN